jgi:hypothetical protein
MLIYTVRVYKFYLLFLTRSDFWFQETAKLFLIFLLSHKQATNVLTVPLKINCLHKSKQKNSRLQYLSRSVNP